MDALVRKTGLGRLAVLAAATIGVLVLPACAATSTSATSQSAAQPTASGSALPREAIVALSEVQSYFPDVTQETSTGTNPTASGNPTATRIVSYANSDGTKKVTISADAYENPDDASSAFEQAAEKSRSVPGFEPLPAPSVGDQAFAGSVTQGAETHIGMGVLDGKLILGATMAGYDPTPDNIEKLVAVVRAEMAAAKNR